MTAGKTGSTFSDKGIITIWKTFDKIVDICFFGSVYDLCHEKPITARQCIQALVQIGQAKKQYILIILSALHSADLSMYKDSMRPLIEKDIANTERILTIDRYTIR